MGPPLLVAKERMGDLGRVLAEGARARSGGVEEEPAATEAAASSVELRVLDEMKGEELKGLLFEHPLGDSVPADAARGTVEAGGHSASSSTT